MHRQDAAGERAHLIRVMPNTPCLVGASASAMCLGGHASEEDGEAVRTLFDAVGTIFKVRGGACHASFIRAWRGPQDKFVKCLSRSAIWRFLASSCQQLSICAHARTKTHLHAAGCVSGSLSIVQHGLWPTGALCRGD